MRTVSIKLRRKKEGEISMYLNKKRRDDFLREIRSPLDSVDNNKKTKILRKKMEILNLIRT